MADLSDQFGWCITTIDYLNGLNSELKYVANGYTDAVDELKDNDYLGNFLPHIENLSQEFEEEMDKIIQYIEDEHLDYINGEKEIIRANMGF